MPVAKLDNAPRCQHTKLDGSPCKAPAIRNLDFCHFHLHVARTRDYSLPLIEDAVSLNFAVIQIIRALMDSAIDRKTAGTVLYGLQIAACNMKRLADERKHFDEESAVDREQGLAEFLIDRLRVLHPEDGALNPPPVVDHFDKFERLAADAPAFHDRVATGAPACRADAPASAQAELRSPEQPRAAAPTYVSNQPSQVGNRKSAVIPEIHAVAADGPITRWPDDPISSVPRCLGGGFSSRNKNTAEAARPPIRYLLAARNGSTAARNCCGCSMGSSWPQRSMTARRAPAMAAARRWP